LIAASWVETIPNLPVIILVDDREGVRVREHVAAAGIVV